MTYQAIIEGANGLIWYAYDDIQFKVLDHPELWAMLKQLTSEIKTLTPTLLEPASRRPAIRRRPRQLPARRRDHTGPRVDGPHGTHQ